jgi:hypothetical protein
VPGFVSAKRWRRSSPTSTSRGSILVRHGKGDKRREAGMDDWAWIQLASWIELRRAYPGRAALLRGCRADSRRALVE